MKVCLFRNNTVLGPIPLKVDSSAFISSMDKLCKYSRHNLPLLFDKELNMFLMQEAFVGANPPHLMLSSMHLDSAERTYSKMWVHQIKTSSLRKTHFKVSEKEELTKGSCHHKP